MTSRNIINSDFYQVVNVDSYDNPTSIKPQYLNVANLTQGSNISLANTAGNWTISANVQYSNSNVAAYLPTLTSNVTTTANVQSAYLIGNGAFITGLPIGNYSNTNVASYLTVLTSNVTTTANVTGAYHIGNGALLTGINANYSNANVANYVGVLTSNVTTSANVSGSYVLGNGRVLTGLTTTQVTISSTPTYTYTLVRNNINPTANAIPWNGGGSVPYAIGTTSIVLVNGLAVPNYTGQLIPGQTFAFPNVSNTIYTVTASDYGVSIAGATTITFTPALTSAIQTWMNTSNPIYFANASGGGGNGTFIPSTLNFTGGGFTYTSANNNLTVNTDGAYGNSNVALYLPTYLPAYTGNLTANNASFSNVANTTLTRLREPVTLSTQTTTTIALALNGNGIYYNTVAITGSVTLAVTTTGSQHAAGYVESATVILTNGSGTGVIATVTIDGIQQTVRWLGSAPAANTTGLDVYAFNFIETATNTWTVIGSRATTT